MPYGFNLDGFQDKDFVNQLKEMTTKFYSEGRTIDLIDNQPGNKNKESLNMFENNIEVQDGRGCVFSPKGEVALSQKFVEVIPLKVDDMVCYKDLEKTYLGMMMRNTEIPFERQLAESYITKIRRFNEIFLWNGINAGTLQYNGLAKQIGSSNSVIDASAEVETADSYIGKVNAMISKMNADIFESDDIRIFCSFSFYQNYIQELIARNHYLMPETYKVGEKLKPELLIPATNVILTPVLGLDHLSNVRKTDGEWLVLTYSKNLVASYDGLGDSENFEMLVNPYTGKNLQVSANWKLGSAYRWDDRIIRGYSLVSAS